jgi:hypothetical protein
LISCRFLDHSMYGSSSGLLLKLYRAVKAHRPEACEMAHLAHAS